MMMLFNLLGIASSRAPSAAFGGTSPAGGGGKQNAVPISFFPRLRGKW
jgi:hypothetical protein